MTIVQNLLTNPSLEASGANWRSDSTGTRERIQAGRDGGWCFRITRGASGALNAYPWAAAEPPAGVASVTGAWVRVSVAAAVRTVALLLNSAGGTVATITGPVLNAAAGSWAWVPGADFTMPAGVASVYLVVTLVNAEAVPAGTTMDVDQAMVLVGTSQATYFDGDSPGWAWTGAPHASASRGPLRFEPEAELRTMAGRVEWVDVVHGYAEETPTRTSVQESLLTNAAPPAITIRRAGLRRGQLQLVIRSETAAGDAAARAARMAESLRSGVVHELRLQRSGSAPLWGRPFVAAGGSVALELDRQTLRAWLLTFDWQATS